MDTARVARRPVTVPMTGTYSRCQVADQLPVQYRHQLPWQCRIPECPSTRRVAWNLLSCLSRDSVEHKALGLEFAHSQVAHQFFDRHRGDLHAMQSLGFSMASARVTLINATCTWSMVRRIKTGRA